MVSVASGQGVMQIHNSASGAIQVMAQHPRDQFNSRWKSPIFLLCRDYQMMAIRDQ